MLAEAITRYLEGGEVGCWKRFSLADAAVLAFLALPMVVGAFVLLSQAAWERTPHYDLGCWRNMHNIALGLGQWQADHDGEYPVTLDFNVTEEMISSAWGRIYSAGYCHDEDVYVCPSTEKRVNLHVFADTPTASQPYAGELWTENAPVVYAFIRWAERREVSATVRDMTVLYNRDYVDLLNASYNYDNARIHKNSAAGRIIAGDGLWRQWMRNASKPNLDSGEDWQYEGIEPNHEDGAYVVYDDKAVAYIKRTLNYKRWIPYQADATLAGSTISLETEPDCDSARPGPNRPCLGARFDWVRQGVIQNPRIEEDELPNGPNEHDDAYAIEGVPGAPDMADQWWMLSEFQFETGVLIGAANWQTDGHGRITGVGDIPEATVLVSKSKTDASIQPFRHYRPGTGWPDDKREARPSESRLPIGDHAAGDIWTY